MRRWLALGILSAAAVAFSARPASADTIGLFDWTLDPFGGPAFDILNLSDPAGLNLQLNDPRVELNGDPALVFDLFSDPSDPAGDPHVVSPGYSAITIDDLSQATSAVLLLGSVTPGGALTINYFNVDANGNPVAGTSLLALGDFATIDYTAAVPEPGTLALLGIGALTAAAWRRRTSVRRR
ncbi:MAG: PEP-CTERM sorting domain-containing protein [Betaproteobacteria bacterium]